jgi:hypothetical protein
VILWLDVLVIQGLGFGLNQLDWGLHDQGQPYSYIWQPSFAISWQILASVLYLELVCMTNGLPFKPGVYRNHPLAILISQQVNVDVMYSEYEKLNQPFMQTTISCPCSKHSHSLVVNL